MCSGAGAANSIISIKEEHTCHYTVVFATPFLCQHPLFTDEVRGRGEIGLAGRGAASGGSDGGTLRGGGDAHG